MSSTYLSSLLEYILSGHVISLLFYPVIINNSHVCIQIPGNKLCFSLTLFSHYFLILLGFSLSAYVVQVLSNYRSCNYLYWGRILGRNPDKSPKSFPPCYSQWRLLLCFESSIFSNSRNLLQFLQFTYRTL